MPQFQVNTSLYCTPHSANSELQRVTDRLSARDWNIDSSSVDVSTWGYILAVNNPISLVISKASGTQSQAEKDVDAALHETNNFSLAAEVGTTVQKLAEAATDTLSNPNAVGQGIGEGLGLVIVGSLVLIVAYIYVRKRL